MLQVNFMSSFAQPLFRVFVLQRFFQGTVDRVLMAFLILSWNRLDRCQVRREGWLVHL
jgi:hypothetical protein